MEIDYQSKISTVVNNIAPSAIRRFFDLANEMKGEVISLSIGEPDFVTPWNIREAGNRTFLILESLLHMVFIDGTIFLKQRCLWFHRA